MKEPELDSCGCCEGIEKQTPLPRANRPGLDHLRYRVGTHATFLETMKADLTGERVEQKDPGTGETQTFEPLRRLTTRDASDPAIALLDAWATVADVLTFYQERIANEGYLRTAAERRSLLELGRLVGYRLRPGVAASTYLAFSLDEDYRLEIPAGTRAQSLPRPGELPQPFETSEPLQARHEWNTLQPRLTRPQRITASMTHLYLAGTATGLKPNDMLVLDLGTSKRAFRVLGAEPDVPGDRTCVTVQPWNAPSGATAPASGHALALSSSGLPSSLHASNLRALRDSLSEMAGLSSAQWAALLVDLSRALLETFEVVMAMGPSATRDAAVRETVAALRSVQAALQALDGHVPAQAVLKQAVQAMLDWLAEALAILTGKTLPSSRKGQGSDLKSLVSGLLVPVPATALPPRSAAYLRLTPGVQLGRDSDLAPQLMVEMNATLKRHLYAAWTQLEVTAPQPVKVYAMRTRIGLFGHNAPKEIKFATGDGNGGDNGGVIVLAAVPKPGTPLPPSQWGEWPLDPSETEDKLYLEREIDEILPGSLVAVQVPDAPGADTFDLNVVEVSSVAGQSRNAYGLSASTTVLKLAGDWRQAFSTDEYDAAKFVRFVRRTTVYAASEELPLAEEPIEDPVPAVANGDEVELAGLYEGLKPGRWLILAGEDAALAGVTRSELAMLANVDQVFDPTLPGDRVHSNLRLANPPAYRYKRESLKIYGNVAAATHGESRDEVLGNGDGGQAYQRFKLKQAPLTYIAAASPSGVESTLRVYIDDVQWPEVRDAAALQSGQRGFITRADDKGNTTVVFGDGKHGRRLPAGRENVRALYRNGIGEPGNVAAEAISLLVTRPQGVSGVNNPLPATGGAGPESEDQARRNIPVALMALDRLVSVQDYADLSRTFAGIAKASAIRISDGHQELVHVTVAGVHDIPIAPTSDLYRNLVAALRRYGDPYQPLHVDVRQLKVLLLRARVRIRPDRRWEKVEPQVRAALLEALGFEQQQLGQDVVKSQVLSIIQAVPGVAYVDLDLLDGIDEEVARDPDALAGALSALEAALANPASLPPEQQQPRRRVRVELARFENGRIRPAQIAYLSRDIPAALILEEITT
jgi:hypothetical protein